MWSKWWEKTYLKRTKKFRINFKKNSFLKRENVKQNYLKETYLEVKQKL
jgi:hypothetical protein